VRISSLLMPLAIVAGFTASVIPCHASATETAAPLSPEQCQQLGGPLPCQPAQPGPWTYHLDDMTFTSEANAYAHMLSLYGPSSIFALAYRWGRSNPNPGPPEKARSIETMSWKMYYRECSGNSTGAPCDEFPRYAGYQRVRSIACPSGYQFSSDASSPYCLPEMAVRHMAQVSIRSAGNVRISGIATATDNLASKGSLGPVSRR
jgi:hypothetical protein